MKEPYEDYHAALKERLRLLGLSEESVLSLGERIENFDADITATRWVSSDQSLLITKGCAKYPGGGKGWHDELLVEESQDREFFRKLLIFSVYFHLTKRPFLPSDLVEIGAMSENSLGYSHIFVSVPYFIPGDTNVVRIADTRFSLLWLMPVYPKEAAYIEKHGSDRFEEKLKSSNYDYFDVRSDLGYLNK